MRPRFTAVLLAGLATGALFWAACAHAQAAPAFEVVPRRVATPPAHRLAWTTALAGAALVAGSFPLAAEADRRYERYLSETNLARIDERFAATSRMDRLASATLIGGEVLLATAVWLRFLRPAPEPRVSLELAPDRCAVALRF
jgi:hypothetical protein